MPGGAAVGNDGHRLVGGVGGVLLHLHVEHGGQAAQALGADAERIDLVEQLQAQRLAAIGRTAGLQIMDVDGFHQRFLGQQHRLLRGAADADAE